MKILIYMLQVSACTGVFYSFYYLFLRRLTFFTINRWYLLVTLFLSFVIPTLTISLNNVADSTIMKPVIYVQSIQTLNTAPNIGIAPQQPQATQVDWMAVLKTGYLVITAICVLQLLLALFSFFQQMSSKTLLQIGKVKVLKGNSKIGNSSFFNVIFIYDDELEPEEIKQIISHEMLHIKLMHSVDRVVSRIAQIILWFNPFVYLYIRSIVENHEFEVDRMIATDGDKGLYANLLLKLAVTGQGYIFHSFSKVPLKKRIAMLFNQPTANMKKITYVLIVPVVLISFMAFAKLKINNQQVSLHTAQNGPSAVGDLSELGPHPLVIIDGKEYPDDILYKISGHCIEATSTFGPHPVVGKYKGNFKANDGVIEITTKKHVITWLTADEKENMAREAAIPKSSFYTKIKLVNNGKEDQEEVRVYLSGMFLGNTFDRGKKVALIFDGKVYPENEVRKVEELVKTHSVGESGTGSARELKNETKEDISAYQIIFYFKLKNDTTHIKKTSGQVKPKAVDPNDLEAYRQTDDYKQKVAILSLISNKTLTVFVKDKLYDATGQQRAFLITYKNHQYVLDSRWGQDKQLRTLLKVGDLATIHFHGGGFEMGSSELRIAASEVYKNNKIVFQIAEAAPISKAPFSTTPNNVKVVEGQITNIQKYPNGKWKVATIEEVNGYDFVLNIKPTAPDFNGIEDDDHVRLLFVNEGEARGKVYKINNWLSVSNDPKNYGVKNPELFNKYYN